MSGRAAEAAAAAGWGVPGTFEDRPALILSARGLAFTGDTIPLPVVLRTPGVGAGLPVTLPEGPPSLLSSSIFLSTVGTLAPGCLAATPAPVFGRSIVRAGSLFALAGTTPAGRLTFLRGMAPVFATFTLTAFARSMLSRSTLTTAFFTAAFAYAVRAVLTDRSRVTLLYMV
jgi:hypothetical protein